MDTNGDTKMLLFKDLSSRLPYGVRILYNGWDSDRDCEFSTIETLIGIDDRFIYTLWRDEKDKHSIVEPLSITDYKPYLRPLSSMTEEEKEELKTLFDAEEVTSDSICYLEGGTLIEYLSRISYSFCSEIIDWLNAHYFDHHNLIEKGLALEAPSEMY